MNFQRARNATPRGDNITPDIMAIVNSFCFLKVSPGLKQTYKPFNTVGKKPFSMEESFENSVHFTVRT